MSKQIRPILVMLTVIGSTTATADRATPVNVVTATSAPIHEEVSLTGTLRARRVSRLSPEVEGVVRAVLVDDGDGVGTGDILVRLDPELAEIAQRSAHARLAEAQARAAEAERRYREMIELVKRQHVPATNVAAARAEVEISAAAARQSGAELMRTEEIVERHVIKAPFAGVINEKLVEVGEWVETNTALVELVEWSVLRIEVPVPQYYFSRVAIGTAVTARLDALPDRLLDGHVTSKIPVNDTAARTFRVRIEIPNDGGLMGPGMSARVTMRLTQADEELALLLPRDALVRKPDGTETVWVIAEEDGVTRANPRAVTTGRNYRDNVEILEGAVTPGTRVIVRGNELLRPGEIVVVADELSMDI